MRDKAGWPIVSTWIDEAEIGQTADLEELWRRIVAEIDSSCGVILYAEPGDFPLKGAIVECGIAIGKGKKIGLVLPGVALSVPGMRPIGSWMMHPLVKICATVEKARHWIEAA